ncbi:MAG: HAD family hydrolase [Chloroflexota bacterium]|nr:HAD family hydrolase [Chloroflexota bacterium]
MTIAAFFDMDRTLLTDSSSLLWMRYMRQRGELPLSAVLRFSGLMARYKMGCLNMVKTSRALAKELEGEREVDRVTATGQWFRDQVVDYVAAEGRRWLDAHRRLGHRVVIITGSPVYTANELAGHLGIAGEDVLGTRFRVVNGYFTGHMVDPMCYGEGKRVIAEAYAGKHGVDLESSYFYTDSVSDLPLLERVGFPVAVNPDPALRRQAEGKGWSIQRFY